MMPTVICFGELMMRLNTPHHQRFTQSAQWEIFYGGSEANVSVLLSRLGTKAGFVTRLPENDLGQAALESLRHHGVDTSGIVRGGERLGLYFTETSNTLRPSKVIYDRKDSSFASITPGMIPWASIFSGASWFHWSGISAAVSASGAAVCLEAVQAAKKSGITISADLNYRSTLWKYGKQPSEIMPELLSYCDVITADLDAAAVYFGIVAEPERSREDLLTQCGKKISEKLPALKVLAMTFRETKDAGSQLYSGVLMSGGKVHPSRVVEFGDVVERIGSGDAFMAGLLYGLALDYPHAEVIDFAVAAGALKHSVPGEYAILTKTEIENFLSQGNAKGKIIR
jgi:2-dehydro-3-deoxygluconokinase